ncbi:MAG: hypothetical protein GY699_03780 [Desulfobacteraceae bacterium]|nr:hypothetical protein [Desulfobacteraceae bacterium]
MSAICMMWKPSGTFSQLDEVPQCVTTIKWCDGTGQHRLAVNPVCDMLRITVKI